MEFRRDIFRIFAYVEAPVDHDDPHERRREEVRHVVVERSQFVHFGLVLGVDRVQLLVDALQLFVGALQLLVGRQQLFVGSLQLRVDALELAHCLLEALLRLVQLLLQVRDPLRRSGIHVVLLRMDLGAHVLRSEKSERRHSGDRPQAVPQRLRDQGDQLPLIAFRHRDPVVGDPLLPLPCFLEGFRDGDLELRPDQAENVQRDRSHRQHDEVLAVPVGVRELVLVVHEDARRQQHFQDARVQLVGRVRQVRLLRVAVHARCPHVALHSLHGVGDVLVRRGLAGRVVNEDLLVGADHTEDVVIVNDGLAPPEEQVAPVLERHVEDGEEIALQNILEIDQQVPAADQVQLPEWRILEHVVLREDDHLADLVPHDVAVALAAEIARQPPRRHILDDVVAVDAPSGRGYGVAVQVGGKYFDISLDAELLHHLREQDRDGIGFFACGAPRHPDADLLRGRRALDDVVDHSVLQHVKIVRIPEKARHADEELLGEEPGLVRVVGQIVDIFLEIAVVRDDDAPLDAPQDRRLLIIGIIDVGHVPQDREDLGHQVAVAELEPVAGVHHGRGDVAHLPRDAVRVEDKVHEARGDGVARHPVELGALGGLHDDHAVLVLDRADPVGPVGARARQDHGHRPVLIGSRQRAEEYVDRMVDIPVVVLLEPQDVRYDFQIIFGRDHVDMVAPYTHAVLRFHHGHRRVLPEDVRQKALVVRRQVLDDDERHPRIFGKKSQELLQRLQSARGRADADHTVRLVADPGRDPGLAVLFIVHLPVSPCIVSSAVFRILCYAHIALRF